MAKRDPRRFERETLGSGLTLVRQAAPPGALSVSMTYIGPGGTSYDPTGAEGTALLASELATVAAGSRDRRALARHLDALGGSLSDHPSPECTEITAWGPTPRWAELLDLLADAVLRPRYDGDDVGRARRQLRERQMRERTQPDLRAESELLRALFPRSHPYHRTGIGDARSIARLRSGDLRRFHDRHVTAEGAALVVTGEIDPRPLRRRAAEAFAELDGRPAPPRPGTTAHPTPRPGERRLTMPGKTQVEIRVGASAVPRGDPAFPAAFLANEVLGGQVLLSRLFQRLREQEGLVYGASSDLEAMGWGGVWEAQAGTGPERATAAERSLHQELARLRDEPVGSAELDRIRESTIGSMSLEIETTQGAHDLAVAAAYYALPESYYLDWPATLRAISPGQLRDAARHDLAPERLATVVVGP